jgi:hypothetical protein
MTGPWFRNSRPSGEMPFLDVRLSIGPAFGLEHNPNEKSVIDVKCTVVLRSGSL